MGRTRRLRINYSFSIVEGHLFIDEGIIFNKNINNNIILYTFLSLIFGKIQHFCKLDIHLIFHHVLKGKKTFKNNGRFNDKA